ncbi:putative wall-associated receptor kinase-like 16 [Hordeum vulgare subsp. vulgare]|uniref:Protein kinase domain-containing protein n=1 Tax=Hordeum vulgare subsp. vulgare TaxID=112509 RepID=A0A8I6WDD2_HORVV|nr:putative wall-associated receptor kinase-like 16 [Hordeum vulgare subsp. vulgare]
MQPLLRLGLGLALLAVAAQYATGTVAPGSECRRWCGDVEIPYPFGIDPGCSLGEDFDISCKVQDGIRKPFKYTLEVLSISLTNSTARVLNNIMGYCYNNSTTSMEEFGNSMDVGEISPSPSFPYRLSDVHNKFTVIGCNALAFMSDTDDTGTGYQAYGVASCRGLTDLVDGSCSGIGCSQTTIPKKMRNYYTDFLKSVNTSKIWEFNPCSYAVLMETTRFNFSTSYISNTVFNDTYLGRVPMVVDWAIRNVSSCEAAQRNNTSTYACLSSSSKCVNSTNDLGYTCSCIPGYDGNPYLLDGCTDVNECKDHPCPSDGFCHNTDGGYWCSCGQGKVFAYKSNTCNPDTRFIIGVTIGLFGLMVIIMATIFWGQMICQKRKLSKVKQEYFRQHGGVLLFDKMKSEKGLAFTVFSEDELIHATNNFDNSRILGRGGHGTVYKGIMKDKMPVAIKRCGLVDERQKKEFGQEIIILSQINHKNIVKLLGCCLEVEVPILVYEFVLNGTLFELIHGENRLLKISFSTLLRIAHEAAEGLSFLHSYASPPIIHGDVKSSNILLDNNYMAKVSDFGTSILAPSDKEQFVTIVQGTCGYLDPEYMQTCQLTDRSDVYSFGVILLEILTGQLPLKLEGSETQRSLSSVFLSAMKKNNLDDVLASHVKGQESMELLTGLADLAKKCLDMHGINRPSMKEVADELNKLRKLSLHPWLQLDMETDAESLLGGESTSGHEIELSGYTIIGENENQPINTKGSCYAK